MGGGLRRHPCQTNNFCSSKNTIFFIVLGKQYSLLDAEKQRRLAHTRLVPLSFLH